MMRCARVAGLALVVALAATGCGSSDGGTGAAAGNEAGAPPTTDVPDLRPADSTATTVTTTSTAPDVVRVTTTTRAVVRPRTTAAATEEDPVPVGEVVDVTGLWDITVTDVQLDAAGVVLAFAEINPSPEPGYRYVLVTLEGEYLGEGVAQPAFEWAITDGEMVFEPSIPGCGVVPDSIYDVSDVVPGERFVANVCMAVPTVSVEQGLTLFLNVVGDEAHYFELS